jgi:hypothetical protein
MVAFRVERPQSPSMLPPHRPPPRQCHRGRNDLDPVHLRRFALPAQLLDPRLRKLDAGEQFRPPRIDRAHPQLAIHALTQLGLDRQVSSGRCVLERSVWRRNGAVPLLDHAPAPAPLKVEEVAGLIQTV